LLWSLLWLPAIVVAVAAGCVYTDKASDVVGLGCCRQLS